MNILTSKLLRLHEGEESLYNKSVELIQGSEDLLLHFTVVEATMDIADIFRQLPNDDEDIKVLQFLGIRIFNACASSIKLLMSGYYHNSAMIMRDILETVFLLNLFSINPKYIHKWRTSSKEERLKEFQPVKVRIKLDDHYGNKEKKRAKMYELFSELAGHPTMLSKNMLKPKGMDIQMGPFVDPTSLEATLSELGRLAMQASETLDSFIPIDYICGKTSKETFKELKEKWIIKFYGDVVCAIKKVK